MSALGLFDFSRLLDRADPQTERIAGLEAQIADKTATVDRLVEDFSASTPPIVSKRISFLSAEVESLTAELAEAKRTARIAEAQETRDAYAEFRALVDRLPEMPDDDSRFQLRARIAAELRRRIGSAMANGTELTIALQRTEFYRIELLFKRSELDSLRLVSIEGGRTFVFPRDVVMGDPDLAGLFAGYVGSQEGSMAV